MEYIKAKTIVTKTKSSGWFGADYNMNIYRGCCHGCIYCDSRSSCYRIDDFDTVKAKENALTVIRSDLRSKRTSGVVATGAMSDPYNPYEKELCLTRHALELLSAFGFGVAIATKSPLVTRDIDVLNEIAAHAPVIIKMTITAYDDHLAKIIEPHAPTSSERFDALSALSEKDIFTGILLMPVLPFITDHEENILHIVKAAHLSGAKFIYPGFGVTLRENQRDYFYEQLDNHFPGIKQNYIRTYGNTYSCGMQTYTKTSALFKQACEKYGILYRMKDIIAAYKNSSNNQQLNFF